MSLTDQQRFTAIYRAHLGRVLAYARRRVASAEEAEEVAAETFTVAWRRLDEIPKEALPWLYGVARNTVLNQRRGQRRREALVRALEDEGLRAGSLGAQAPPTVTQEMRLTRALDTLDADEREALLLVAWEDLTTKDAAAAMGVSRATFSRRLASARRRVGALIGADPLNESAGVGAPPRTTKDPQR